MNYIKQLQQDRLALAGKLSRVLLEINDFKVFLQTSPKFQNNTDVGERKDWIATEDVINRLIEIKNLI